MENDCSWIYENSGYGCFKEKETPMLADLVLWVEVFLGCYHPKEPFIFCSSLCFESSYCVQCIV